MSHAAQAIIELEARLQLAVEALNAARPGQQPLGSDDIQLHHHDQATQSRLIEAATRRFWARLAGDPNDEPMHPLAASPLAEIRRRQIHAS